MTLTFEILTMTGRRVWWVADKDLGSGPFRWQVYRAEQAGLLGASEPFELSAGRSETLLVEVVLASP